MDDRYVDAVLDDTRGKMSKATDHARLELAALRTGRTAPALVEKLRVDLFGVEVSRQPLAGVQGRQAKTLVITPHDKVTLKRSSEPSRSPTSVSTPTTMEQ